jgi:glycosyltransferase involved in cell wall biosynthesis
MKLALTTLCENPTHQTALTTMFHEFLKHSLRLYPELSWIVFAGPNQHLGVEHVRLQYERRFPAGDRLGPRLFADHFRVAPLARALGASGLVTIGFVPLRHVLPTFMHINSLQHLSRDNRLGRLRHLYRTSIVRHGLRNAALVITNSASARSQLLAAHPHCRDKLFMSHEGTQPQYQPEPAPGEVEALRKEFGFGPGYLLWVSNFYHYKQAPLLIQAYALLPEAVRRQMPIVMVGGDWDGGLAAAQAAAVAGGVTDNIRFLGWVAEQWLAPLYRSALAFVLPSREETFGRCTTEAMSCGTPCVLNDIPTNREISGGHALIIDFADPQLVARTLQRLFDEPALRQKLREQGLAQAKNFSFENMTRTRIDAILATLARVKR